MTNDWIHPTERVFPKGQPMRLIDWFTLIFSVVYVGMLVWLVLKYR